MPLFNVSWSGGDEQIDAADEDDARQDALDSIAITVEPVDEDEVSVEEEEE